MLVISTRCCSATLLLWAAARLVDEKAARERLCTLRPTDGRASSGPRRGAERHPPESRAADRPTLTAQLRQLLGPNRPQHHARDTRAEVKGSLGRCVTTYLLFAKLASHADPRRGRTRPPVSARSEAKARVVAMRAAERSGCGFSGAGVRAVGGARSRRPKWRVFRWIKAGVGDVPGASPSARAWVICAHAPVSQSSRLGEDHVRMGEVNPEESLEIRVAVQATR